MTKKHNHKGKKKPNYKVIGIVVGVVVLVFLSQFLFKGDKITSGLDSETLDNFAKCLTANGATFYGTFRCGHCKTQKSMFGKSMKYVNFVDCDQKSDLCEQEGIAGYPTWKFADGTATPGVQQFETLAYNAGCELN